MLVAGHAAGAGAVPAQGHDGDVVSDLPPGDSFADHGDPAAHLVADDGGDVHPSIHVTMEDMKVGATYTGIGHLDPDLARSHGFGIEVTYFNVSGTQVVRG